MRTFKHLILILINVCASFSMNAQWCCVDTVLKIPDRDTVSLKLNISGAFINNLADPSQGVCGVKIKFNHKFIGDMIVELVSPQGQRVRLLGPIGNSGKTDFTKWFVTFVPCGEVAIPDFGFKAKWDNNQAWGILGKFYTGTYYPNAGCLEDFNSGSVNGTWTLAISDNERFYDGVIESFCLLFCDQTGINCTDCSPNGGYFVNNSLSFCEGSQNIPTGDTIVFPTYIPDNSKYNYAYILSIQDTIIQIGPYPDLKSLPVGNYTLCGISYLNIDSLSLPKPGDLLSVVRANILSNALGICAEFSKNCLSISVFQSFNAGVQNVFLCTGDSIILNNDKYDQSGIYLVEFKTIDQCDSVLTLNLQLVDIKINSQPLDTISCLNPNVFIDLRNSIITTKSSFTWTTINGNIVDQSDPLFIQVNDSGLYKLIIHDGNCIDSAEFRIIKTGATPDLLIISDTISCSKVNATIKARTNAMNPNFNWSNGQIQIGIDSILVVGISGEYFLTITDENGCTNYSSINIIADTNPAQLQTFATDINCKDSLSQLSYISNKNLKQVKWTGPMSFLSIVDTSYTKNPGWYNLTVISANDCLTEDSILVSSLVSVPDYDLSIDTLSCLKKNFILQDRSSAVIDSISYLGPFGTRFNDFNPLIVLPGLYSVTLVDTSGCTLDTTFTIPIDTSTADFLLSADKLNCLIDSIQLVVNLFSDSLGLDYFWSGPISFSSNAKNPFVSETGLYTVDITSSNGCVKTDTVRVERDSIKPDVFIEMPLILSCSLQELMLKATSTAALLYNWSGPGTFTQTISDPLVSLPGLYKLVVTAANGCTAESTVQVISDTVLPIKKLIADTISCNKDFALIRFNKAHDFDSISWSGPMGTLTEKDTIVNVKSGGEYSLYVRGTNGCLDSAKVFVFMDTISPIFVLRADTLDCLRPEANVQVITNDTNILYRWNLVNGDSLIAKNLKVSQAGIYKLQATALNGCTSQAVVEVIELKGRPVVNKFTDTLTCAKQMVNVGVRSLDAMLNYNWSGPNGFISVDSIIQVDVPGWYVYSVTNSFGCITLDSLFVPQFIDTPRVLFNNPIVDCQSKSDPRLIANFIDSLDFFQWTDPNGNIINTRDIKLAQSGLFIFEGENSFGCKIRDSLMVQFDTLGPVILAIHLDTLDCATNQVIPLVETLPANCSYLWMGPGLPPTNLPNPIILQAGQFSLSLIAANHCTTDSLISVVIDTASPVIQAIGGSIDCGSQSLILHINSNDSLAMVFWQGPMGKIYNLREPMVRDTGWYVAVVRGLNDCFAFDSAYVALDNKVPDLTVNDHYIPCDLDSISLNAFSKDTGLVYSWLGPNQFQSNLKSPFVSDTGFYILTVNSVNQCKTMDTIRVDFKRDPPTLKLVGDSINCIKSYANLIALCDSAQMKINWSGPGLNDTTGFSKKVFTEGWYGVEITNVHGCKKDTTLYVSLDTSRPNVVIGQLDSLICDQKTAKLYLFQNSGPLLISWSSLDGMILGSNSSDTLLVGAPGNYKLKILNTTNGCEDSSQFRLSAMPSTLTGMNLIVMQPSCFGAMDGEIRIDSIWGGYGPFQYSFDGLNYGNGSAILQLKAGGYNVWVKDRFGCVKDTSMILLSPPVLTLDLGRDTTIRFGDQLAINPITNANIARLNSLEWIPDTELGCASCFEVISKPSSEIRYILRITDEFGCSVEDSILIRLIILPEIYIPNAFSPNRDDINDRITIQASPLVERIMSFQIFDRWGNRVYSKTDFIPGQFELLWDGSIDGELLNPAVFVYLIEARLIDGTNFQQKGDISLIR